MLLDGCICDWNTVGIKGAHHLKGCPIVQDLYCRVCAAFVAPENSDWVWGGNFYCSQKCCQEAARNG